MIRALIEFRRALQILMHPLPSEIHFRCSLGQWFRLVNSIENLGVEYPELVIQPFILLGIKFVWDGE